MDVEFEEFDTVEEIFLYMACVASPMKNICQLILTKDIFALLYR